MVDRDVGQSNPLRESRLGVNEVTDVLVIGAGFAGLQAARSLEEAGLSVRVVEARQGVGGRAITQKIGGGDFDLGAQWTGPSQDRLCRLASHFGIPTFPTHHEGTKILDLDGKISTYKTTIPTISAGNVALLQSALFFLEFFRKQVDPEAPFEAPQAAKWAGMSVEEFKRKILPATGIREVLDIGVRMVFGEEPENISLLHFLSYLNASGGLKKLVEIKGGAQERRFVGGAEAVATAMAKALKGDLIFESPVISVEQDERGVVVQSGHRTFRARYVVACLPPPLLLKIQFSPELPAKKKQACAEMSMGQTIKFVATYEQPFWREQGFSGEVVSSNGPVTAVFDNTSHEGKTPALVGFSVGKIGRQLSKLGAHERKKLVLETFANYFGPKALVPTDYAEKDWLAEKFSGGGPVANRKPSKEIAGDGLLQKPWGRIHFAGSETATEWTGYIEGALQSGERAAFEVIERRFKVRRAKPLPKLVRPMSLGMLNRDVLDAPSMVQAHLIREGVASPVELTRGYIHRISEANPKLNAMVQDRFAEALIEAEAAEDRIRSGQALDSLPPLFGVACTIKEFFSIKGMPHTGALAKRAGVIAEQDSVVVRRIRQAGAIPLGITNAPEGGLWMETHNSITGRTNNPWHPLRTPGGSSGGEGALLAVGASSFGIGSDVGGSIRIPAAFCGVYGHKPSGLLVPNEGHYPAGGGKIERYLCAGPMTRSARDLWPLLKVLAGPYQKKDGADWSVHSLLEEREDVNFSELVVYPLANTGRFTVSKVMRDAVKRATDELVSRGARVAQLNEPRLKRAFEIWSAMLADAGGSTFAEILGAGDTFEVGSEWLRWIKRQSDHTVSGLLVATAEYLPKLMPEYTSELASLGRELQLELESVLGENGVILHPPYSRVAPHHYLAWTTPFHVACTAIFNVMEFPATQVPLGLDRNNMPVGVQIVGKRGRDSLTIQLAEHFEQAFGGWIKAPMPTSTKSKWKSLRNWL